MITYIPKSSMDHQYHLQQELVSRDLIGLIGLVVPPGISMPIFLGDPMTTRDSFTCPGYATALL